ncbi:hypothetical protein QUF55_09330, partial [Clostridiaceae bacterium HSG29]|nr:hypothetical protein [Clostridiaceae bacterium HSG29]
MNNINNDYNKFHKILIDKINEPLLVINHDLVCIDANRYFLEAFKIDLTQIININCKNILKDF